MNTSNPTPSPSPTPQSQFTRRAKADLLQYPIESSQTLLDIYNWLKTSSCIETREHKERKTTRVTDYARDMVVSISKYLRYEQSTDKKCDDLDLLTELQNTNKLKSFLQYLCDQGFGNSTRLKYINANAKALEWIASKNLSMEKRCVVDHLRQYFRDMKVPRQHEKSKETRQRQSRESLESRGEWLDQKAFSHIIESIMKMQQTLLNKPDSLINVTDAVRYRSYCITHAQLASKICRRMSYNNLTVSQWGSLEIKDGKKVMFTDKFKTSKTYALDCVIFHPDTATMIDHYIERFRPILASKKPKAGSQQQGTNEAEKDYLWLTKYGTHYVNLSEDVNAVIKTIYPDKHITITDLRKIIATLAAETGSDEDRKSLAANDKHSLSTVRHHYEKQSQYDIAKKGLEAQQRLTCSNRPPPPNDLNQLSRDQLIALIMNSPISPPPNYVSPTSSSSSSAVTLTSTPSITIPTTPATTSLTTSTTVKCKLSFTTEQDDAILKFAQEYNGQRTPWKTLKDTSGELFKDYKPEQLRIRYNTISRRQPNKRKLDEVDTDEDPQPTKRART